MWMLLKTVLIVSGLASVSAFGTLGLVSAEALIAATVTVIFLKIFTLAICILLFLNMHNKPSRFFYINLVMSVNKLILMAVTLDLSLFIAGLILLLVLRYGIS